MGKSVVGYAVQCRAEDTIKEKRQRSLSASWSTSIQTMACSHLSIVPFLQISRLHSSDPGCQVISACDVITSTTPHFDPYPVRRERDRIGTGG